MKKEIIATLRTVRDSLGMNPLGSCRLLASVASKYEGKTPFAVAASKILKRHADSVRRLVRIGNLPEGAVKAINKNTSLLKLSDLEKLARASLTPSECLKETRRLVAEKKDKASAKKLRAKMVAKPRTTKGPHGSGGHTGMGFPDHGPNCTQCAGHSHSPIAAKPMAEQVSIPAVQKEGLFSQKDINRKFNMLAGRRAPGQIAVALKIVGDPMYGQIDTFATGRGVKGQSWLFSETGMAVLKPYMQRLVEEADLLFRSGKSEEISYIRALEKVLSMVHPIGQGDWTQLTKSVSN